MRESPDPMAASAAVWCQPNEFIMIADECGLLDDIGEWVVFEACRRPRRGSAKD